MAILQHQKLFGLVGHGVCISRLDVTERESCGQTQQLLVLLPQSQTSTPDDGERECTKRELW